MAAAAGPQVSDDYLYRVVDTIDEIAKQTGKTVPQIALNWLLQRPTVATVIIGARDETQLRQNLGSVGWKLTPEQIAKLDAASATSKAYPYWHRRRRAGAMSKRCRLGRTHDLVTDTIRHGRMVHDRQS
jgi:diketogulonate reductase-like aldo/keto reductase